MSFFSPALTILVASAGPTSVPQCLPCSGEPQPGLSTQMWAHKCLIKGKITFLDLLAAVMVIQPCLISNKTGGVLIFGHGLFACSALLTDGAAHICCGQSSCSAQRATSLSHSHCLSPPSYFPGPLSWFLPTDSSFHRLQRLQMLPLSR